MVAACSGGAGAQAAPETQTPSAPAPVSGGPTPATAATPVSRFASQLPSDASPLLRRGEVIFQVEAGGAGCQMCHGRDAKGLVGPNIRGKNATDIENTLQSVQVMMQAIGYLPSDDVEAVAAYLNYLAWQP